MKKYLFTLLAVIVSLWGCDGTGTTPLGQIQLASSSKDVVEIKPEGGKETVRFSSALDWTIEYSCDWITVDPTEGGPGTAKISISAKANETSEAREAVVNICSSGVEFPITVTQAAFVPTFELLETEAEVSCLGGELVVTVYTDMEYSVQCDADWVTCTSTKAPRNRKVTFDVAPNALPENRTAVITFTADNVSKSFTLTQRAAGTEADDWKKADFVHRSLAMRFTATWCGYCPMMATAFDAARNSMPGTLELVNLHGPESDYVFSGTSTLGRRFSIDGYPTGIVDCRASIPNFSSTTTTAAVAVDVAKETQASYPAKTGIACKSALDGTNLTVDLSLYAKEADDYKVTILLMEDGLVGYQNGGGSNYKHDDIARLAVTSVSGDAVKVEKDGMIVNKTYTATVKSSWKAANLELLIYVEKPYGDQGKAKGVSAAVYGSYGDTYIDNCRVVKVGEDAALELK